MMGLTEAHMTEPSGIVISILSLDNNANTVLLGLAVSIYLDLKKISLIPIFSCHKYIAEENVPVIYICIYLYFMSNNFVELVRKGRQKVVGNGCNKPFKPSEIFLNKLKL